MLGRHGTRLELGTADDIAELDAAEAVLRTSYKPSASVVGGGGGGLGGARAVPAPHSHVQSMAGHHGYGGGWDTSVALPPPPPATHGADARDSGVARSSGAAPPPPHVNLGHPAQRHGTAARGAEATPAGQVAAAGGAGRAMTAPSSGMRATAAPFYRPHVTMRETPPYPPTAAVGRTAEEDDGRTASEAATAAAAAAVDRGRPSMRGGVAASLPSRETAAHGRGGRGANEEDSDEPYSRPSRVSGRYQLPRRDAP
ncbi:hypothetical protein NESM_000543800 [Novymonas esmeraldas]|uniref:Uncharacterized protein n=1 Tax=Novymonas esmeraldas TaxID=1808958 RepID=A0AAW0EPK2_9TRYP